MVFPYRIFSIFKHNKHNRTVEDSIWQYFIKKSVLLLFSGSKILCKEWQGKLTKKDTLDVL